jgi:phage terminase small subunit
MTGTALAAPAAEYRLGSRMRALNERQRRFVEALFGGGHANHTQAALIAGYTGDNETVRVTAHRLAHDDKIRAAILEEAQRRMDSSGALVASVLIEIASDPTHKDRLKAALALADRIGLHARTEHKITVEHQDDKGKIELIKHLADKLGIDPGKLLGRAAEPVDVEFSEVMDIEKW